MLLFKNGMGRLLFQIIAGILGFFLAQKFVSGVTIALIPGESSVFGFQLTAFWQILVLSGGILGLLNFFIKPILNLLTLPLRIITLGLFSFIINMFLIWVVDIVFLELTIQGLLPLFWTALIIFGLSFLFGLNYSRK